MAKTFTLEVVSPERLLFSEPAGMVTIPGSEGEFGVLAGHVPLIAALKPGVVRIYSDQGQTVSRRIFVAGGFVEVQRDRTVLMVESATPLEDLKPADLAAERQDLGHQQAKSDLSPGDKARLKERLAVVDAKERALTRFGSR